MKACLRSIPRRVAIADHTEGTPFESEVVRSETVYEVLRRDTYQFHRTKSIPGRLDDRCLFAYTAATPAVRFRWYDGPRQGQVFFAGWLSAKVLHLVRAGMQHAPTSGGNTVVSDTKSRGGAAWQG